MAAPARTAADRPVGPGGPGRQSAPDRRRGDDRRASSCQLFDLRIVGIDYGRHTPLRTLSGKPEPAAPRGLSFFHPRRPVAPGLLDLYALVPSCCPQNRTVVTQITNCDAKRPLEFLYPNNPGFVGGRQKGPVPMRKHLFLRAPFSLRERCRQERGGSRDPRTGVRGYRDRGDRPFQLAYMYGTSGPASGGTAVNLVGNQFESGRDGHDRRRQRHRVGDELDADRRDDPGPQSPARSTTSSSRTPAIRPRS